MKSIHLCKWKQGKKKKLNAVCALLRAEVDLLLAFQMLTCAKLWYELWQKEISAAEKADLVMDGLYWILLPYWKDKKENTKVGMNTNMSCLK